MLNVYVLLPCLLDKQLENISIQEHEPPEPLLHRSLNHTENKPIEE